MRAGDVAHADLRGLQSGDGGGGHAVLEHDGQASGVVLDEKRAAALVELRVGVGEGQARLEVGEPALHQRKDLFVAHRAIEQHQLVIGRVGGRGPAGAIHWRASADADPERGRGREGALAPGRVLQHPVVVEAHALRGVPGDYEVPPLTGLPRLNALSVVRAVLAAVAVDHPDVERAALDVRADELLVIAVLHRGDVHEIRAGRVAAGADLRVVEVVERLEPERDRPAFAEEVAGGVVVERGRAALDLAELRLFVALGQHRLADLPRHDPRVHERSRLRVPARPGGGDALVIGGVEGDAARLVLGGRERLSVGDARQADERGDDGVAHGCASPL